MKKRFYTPMPGKRSPGQMLIAAALEKEMIALMDSVRGRKSRSQYLREAIGEKLQEHGYTIPDSWISSPDRATPLVTSMIAETRGDYSPVHQTTYPSPSAVPPRRVATAKAGKPKPKKTRTKKK